MSDLGLNGSFHSGFMVSATLSTWLGNIPYDSL